MMVIMVNATGSDRLAILADTDYTNPWVSFLTQGMEMKKGKSVIWLFLNINLSTTISMKRSRQELSIDMVIHWGILKITKLRSSSF